MSFRPLPVYASIDSEGAFVIKVKVVPGSKHDEIVGLLGDRLKVRVSASPEAGKANIAVRALIALALGVGIRDVELISGDASAHKSLRTFARPTRWPVQQ